MGPGSRIVDVKALTLPALNYPRFPLHTCKRLQRDGFVARIIAVDRNDEYFGLRRLTYQSQTCPLKCGI